MTNSQQGRVARELNESRHQLNESQSLLRECLDELARREAAKQQEAEVMAAKKQEAEVMAAAAAQNASVAQAALEAVREQLNTTNVQSAARLEATQAELASLRAQLESSRAQAAEERVALQAEVAETQTQAAELMEQRMAAAAAQAAAQAAALLEKELEKEKERAQAEAVAARLALSAMEATLSQTQEEMAKVLEMARAQEMAVATRLNMPWRVKQLSTEAAGAERRSIIIAAAPTAGHKAEALAFYSNRQWRQQPSPERAEKEEPRVNSIGKVVRRQRESFLPRTRVVANASDGDADGTSVSA